MIIARPMRIIIAFFLALAFLFLPGCHSLRRKFIRKKKYQKEAPVYVDLKDYPEKPSREAYIDYYLFIKGWLDELASTLERGMSHKRARRAVNEAVMNLEQIISFYNTEGKDAIYPLYEELLEIKEEVEKNPTASQLKRNALVKKTENLQRRFSARFNYTDAEKWMQ
ncbi:MAG: hypothetical protein JSW40_05610 [Candidatus Omnitrophota bacterium]|nr:MAG: hypothetical protein JSW40_05610 [Candidatus Omnitrophota bacterium]